VYAQAAELVDLNVLAPVLPTQAVLPGMLDRSRGTIINIASLLAFSGAVQIPFLPKRVVYAATKSFLVTFSQALAAEARDRGSRSRSRSSAPGRCARNSTPGREWT